MADDQLTIELTQRPADGGTITLTQPILGTTPYVLVQVDRSEDGDGLALTVESGGGVPQGQEAIVSLLTVVLEGLTEGEDIEATPTAKGSA